MNRQKKGRPNYRLDKIGLRELARGYFRHPAILTYLAILPFSGYFALVLGQFSPAERAARLGVAALVTILLYPLVWYLLHRYVLHATFLYRSPRTASLWKRIHFDHHQDPHDLNVLFGAPWNTLPTIFLLLLPVGYGIGGGAGAAGALTTGLLVTMVYEYCHCIQHLSFSPKSEFLRRMKRLHQLHHFHNEQGNFGITNFLWDRVTGTYYAEAGDRPRSDTVRNLGYAGAERERYPWVSELTERMGGEVA